MRENVADRILTRMNKRVMAVADRLAIQYKGVKPFDAQEIKPEDQLFWYEQLGQMDMAYLVQKYGRESVEQYIYESEMIKQRRKK